MIDIPEDCYGRRKRFEIVQQVIERRRPRRLLDVGCGTGAMLTLAVAQSFPHVEVLGIDTDAASIAWANAQPHPPNLLFCNAAELSEDSRFDVVIASEVLEHVEEPEPFLDWLRSRLLPDGSLIITTPNGYGPFELLMLAAVLLHGPGLKRLLLQIQQKIFRRDSADTARQTLAVSPHVNFFRLPELHLLFAGAGLRVEKYRAGTFLCGPGVETLLRTAQGIDWNARIADRLPHWCASGWLFVLRPTERATRTPWRRGAIGDLRRSLNRRRWGLA